MAKTCICSISIILIVFWLLYFSTLCKWIVRSQLTPKKILFDLNHVLGHPYPLLRTKVKMTFLFLWTIQYSIRSLDQTRSFSMATMMYFQVQVPWSFLLFEKLNWWHWGLVTVSQRVTWTAFAIFAFFASFDISPSWEGNKIIHKRTTSHQPAHICTFSFFFSAICRVLFQSPTVALRELHSYTL